MAPRYISGHVWFFPGRQTRRGGRILDAPLDFNGAWLSEIVDLTTLKVDVAKIHFVEVRRRKAPRLPPDWIVDSLCCKDFTNDLYLQLIYKVDSSTYIYRFTRFIYPFRGFSMTNWHDLWNTRES